MKDILPHYEQELILLRRQAAEFAARFPGPAARLQIVGGSSGDPHVERMIQATALLTARVHKSLEDGYARFTESLLETLFPHYLRPFPSCAVVQVGAPGDAASGAPHALVPRGTALHSQPVDGVPCRFRTCYDVRHQPVRLPQAWFAPVLDAPPSIRVPAGCGASLGIDIEALERNAGFAALHDGVLRVYLAGEPSVAAALRDALHGQVRAAYVEAEPGTWTRLPSVPLAPVGFADDEVLAPFSPRSHPAYRLLAEYFAFPEKFNFVDIDLGAIAAHMPPECRRVTLHLLLAHLHPDADEARLLSTVSAGNLRLGCTPVVNLFRQAAPPILVTHERADYPLLPDADHAGAHDIHTVDAVQVLGRRNATSTVTEFRPFYALRHEDAPGRRGHYYVVRRDATLGPGHAYRIAFVDADFDPASCEHATASVELTCTDGDRPTRIAFGSAAGSAAGDLLAPAGVAAGSALSFVHRPTPPRRFAATPALQWRLLSHLTLNFQSLVQTGLEGFREMLLLYDLAQTPASRRQIASIVGLAHCPTTAWIRSRRGASLVHGIEVTLTVEEDGFVGSGLGLFATVIDRFLGLYVQINSFTELVIVSAKSGKELIRCKPRNGDQYLM